MKNRDATWWSGFFHLRRPVSRLRRWFGVALLVLVMALAIAYHHFTSELRLRQFAEHWLEDFTGGQVRIDYVHFDLFKGLHLVGVNLALPESVAFDPRTNSLAERTIFHSSTLFLRLRPLSIISGDLIVPEVVAENPELNLVHRVSDSVGNWEIMLRRRKKGSGTVSHLPVIRLRNVRLCQYRLDERGRSGGAPQLIWADAQPLEDRPKIYDLEITKVIQGANAQELAGETSRLRIDMRTLAVSGSLPTMAIDELLFAAPAEIIRWLDVLALHGYVRPDTFSFDPKLGGQATLALHDASFSVPIDAAEQKIPSSQRYLRFEEIAGEISFDNQRAHVELEGRFGNSPAFIKGELALEEDRSSALEAMGFNLTLTIFKMPLPRKDNISDPSERNFVRRWTLIDNLVEHYDGVGPVDLSLQMSKQTGTNKAIEFVEATLTLGGVSAQYFRFPYRVNDLTGTVHFREDGKIELKNFTGRHGQGNIIINGLVEGYSSRSGAALDIVGEHIALDDDLLCCLSQADRDLCRQFSAQGHMNLHVRMQREAASPEEPAKPWKSVIDAEFTDGSVSFAGFPYPLDDLSGRMRISDQGFEIERLCATRGRARVYIDGSASRGDGDGPSMDLKLEATAIPLDETLAGALSAEARKKYEQFSPTGQIDLTGRLFRNPGSGRIDYDLAADFSGVELTLPGSTARLTGTKATIHIKPDKVVIESLNGMFGESKVVLTGSIGLGRNDQMLSLQMHAESLPLNDALRCALPASWQVTWDLFKPSGLVDLDMHYIRPSPTSQPVGQGTSEGDFTVTIDPIDCQATFSGFPLPLHGIKGRLVMTPRGAVIEKIAARHAQAGLKLKGRVDFLPDRKQAELAVEATDLTFTEDLRQAVPWRLRRMWNDMQPKGAVDLSFEKMTFTIQPGAKTTWDFRGNVALKNVSAVIGPELTELWGRIHCQGEIGAQFSLTGDVDLSRGRIDGREVTAVTAKLSQPAGDPVFRVGQIVGQFYDGELVGWAEVDYSPDGPKYGLSLTAQDVSLGKFLNAKRKPGEKPIKLEGQVEGNLVLTGRFQDPRTRRGGGNILIREAQMFKVPLLLAILQVIHFAIDDDNAFHDGTVAFIVDGDELILEEIDLRGKALSMIGAGRVHTPTQEMDLTLLVGSPLHLPRLEILSEFMEGVARELMEVHVQGTLVQPRFHADIVRSLRKTLEVILNARRSRHDWHFEGQKWKNEKVVK